VTCSTRANALPLHRSTVWPAAFALLQTTTSRRASATTTQTATWWAVNRLAVLRSVNKTCVGTLAASGVLRVVVTATVCVSPTRFNALLLPALVSPLLNVNHPVLFATIAQLRTCVNRSIINKHSVVLFVQSTIAHLQLAPLAL
jgi:hypothetical protein